MWTAPCTPDLLFNQELLAQAERGLRPFLAQTFSAKTSLLEDFTVFAHNGALQVFSPRLHGNLRLLGNTDGKRAICWIMQKLSTSHAGLPSMAEPTLRKQCRLSRMVLSNLWGVHFRAVYFLTGMGQSALP